jgi:hypothetical protein
MGVATGCGAERENLLCPPPILNSAVLAFFVVQLRECLFTTVEIQQWIGVDGARMTLRILEARFMIGPGTGFAV